MLSRDTVVDEVGVAKDMMVFLQEFFEGDSGPVTMQLMPCVLSC